MTHVPEAAPGADAEIPFGFSSGRYVAFRLLPGMDLIAGLHAAQRQSGATAIAIVTCVGSLTSVLIRHANRDVGTTYQGHFEITSLCGTIGPGHQHLHIAVADGEGRVFGGHLLPGSSIYTTAEIVCVLLDDLSFSREACALSGYAELVVQSRSQSPKGS